MRGCHFTNVCTWMMDGKSGNVFVEERKSDYFCESKNGRGGCCQISRQQIFEGGSSTGVVAELGGTFLCHRLFLSLDLNSFILISPPFSFSPSLLHPHSAACVATVIAIFLDHPGFFYFSIPHSLSPCHVMEGVLTCVFFWDLPMVTWLECAKTMFE